MKFIRTIKKKIEKRKAEKGIIYMSKLLGEMIEDGKMEIDRAMYILEITIWSYLETYS